MKKFVFILVVLLFVVISIFGKENYQSHLDGDMYYHTKIDTFLSMNVEHCSEYVRYISKYIKEFDQAYEEGIAKFYTDLSLSFPKVNSKKVFLNFNSDKGFYITFGEIKQRLAWEWFSMLFFFAGLVYCISAFTREKLSVLEREKHYKSEEFKNLFGGVFLFFLLFLVNIILNIRFESIPKSLLWKSPFVIAASILSIVFVSFFIRGLDERISIFEKTKYYKKKGRIIVSLLMMLFCFFVFFNIDYSLFFYCLGMTVVIILIHVCLWVKDLIKNQKENTEEDE